MGKIKREVGHMIPILIANLLFFLSNALWFFHQLKHLEFNLHFPANARLLQIQLQDICCLLFQLGISVWII
jgi:hypothetical protein